MIDDSRNFFQGAEDALLGSKLFLELEIVGNKAKGRILKRVFQENKARQIFRKTNSSYPLIRTRTTDENKFVFSRLKLKYILHRRTV